MLSLLAEFAAGFALVGPLRRFRSNFINGLKDLQVVLRSGAGS